MNLVENFINEEKKNVTKIEKLFSNYPEFILYKDLKIDEKEYNIKEKTKIKPSVFRRLTAIIFLILGLFFLATLIIMAVQKVLLPIVLVFILLICLWLYFVFWTFFIDPKNIYNLKIDDNGLNTKNLNLTWEKIKEVLIMIKGGGRHQVSTLVLFTNEEKVLKYDIQNLGISDEKLLKLIFIYQKRNQKSTK